MYFEHTCSGFNCHLVLQLYNCLIQISDKQHQLIPVVDEFYLYNFVLLAFIKIQSSVGLEVLQPFDVISTGFYKTIGARLLVILASKCVCVPLVSSDMPLVESLKGSHSSQILVYNV